MDILLAIIFYLVELLLFLLLVTKIKRYKSLTIKDTIVYPLLLVSTFILIIFSRIICDSISFWENIKVSFSDSLNIIKVSTNSDLVSLLSNNSKPLLVAYYGTFAISLCALTSLAIYLFFITLKNIIRIANCFFRNKNIVLLFGYNEDAKKLIKNFKQDNKKMIVVLDSANINKFVEEKAYLDKYKIGYRELPYKEKGDYFKTICKATRWGKKQFTIITFFEEDKKNDEFSTVAIEFLQSPKYLQRDVSFIMNVDAIQDRFIKQKIEDPENHRDSTCGKLRTYNKYDLGSYLFCQKNPLPKFLGILEKEKGEHFINDDCTIENLTINTFFIGFGKVNQSMFRDILITNQFVVKESTKDSKFKLKPYEINVDIYEKEKKLQAFELSTGLLKYNKANYSSNDFLPLPKDYLSKTNFHFDYNVEAPDFINSLYDTIKERNKASKTKQVNFFFVSLDSDMFNCLIAQKIKKHLDSLDNSYDFFFVRSNARDIEKHKNIECYCLDDEIYSYENVVLNDEWENAKEEHFIYSGKTREEFDKSWKNLSMFKQLSNMYSVLGNFFKLKMLRINLENFEEKLSNIEEHVVTSDNIDKLIVPSKEFSPFDVLAYSEHERWNAFELAYGVLPMKKSMFLELNAKEKGNKKVINQTSDENYHFNITSAEGLVEYFDICKTIGFNDENVIKYDYDCLKNILKIFKDLDELGEEHECK